MRTQYGQGTITPVQDGQHSVCIITRRRAIARRRVCVPRGPGKDRFWGRYHLLQWVPAPLSIGRIILATMLCVVTQWSGSSGVAAQPAVSSTISGLHVSGNQLLNGANHPIVLHGVDRSGTEYACIQGWGIFDGPNDATSVQAITSWHTNAVRVPLNEDCWLGINGVNPAYSGSAYHKAILAYANLLNQYGLVVILDLHWSAPSTLQATGQLPMPDADHSVAFWRSVATTFKSHSAVIFDLFNEPYPDFS